MLQAIDVRAALFIDRDQKGDLRTLLSLAGCRPGLTGGLQVRIIHNHPANVQLGNHIVEVIRIGILLALGHDQLAQFLVQ